MNDILKAAIDAAVNAVSEKPESVKDDIKEHLFTSVLVGEQIETICNQISEMITTLGGQFEKMTLDESRLTGYLLENLDLPRGNLSQDAINDLVLLRDEANKENVDVAVVPSKLGFSTLPNNGVVVKREGDEDSAVTHTVAYIKISDNKMLMYVLTNTIESYLVTRANDNLLVEKQLADTTQILGMTLEGIKDTEYAPALMSDRETLVVSELDSEWLNAYLLDHPEILENENNHDPRIIMDKVVKAFVDSSGTEDISTKRIELEHHDELLDTVVGLLEKARADLVPTPTIEELNAVEDVEPMPVVEDDSPLFSEGVAEQTEETVAPVEEDLFGGNTEEEVVIEESTVDVTKSTVETAIGILTTLGENPERALVTIQNSSLSIKDSIYREVLNTLPSVEKRSSVSYTTEEKEEIKTALDIHLRPVLAKIEEYRLKIEKERIDALKYNPDMVLLHIQNNPVHAHLIDGDDKRQEIAEAVSRYLNDNDRDTDTDADDRIAEVLRDISLYGYETEAIINATYRVSNYPSKENLIRNTPVISTTLRKLYTTTKGWDTDSSNVLKDAFDEVFNNTRSALDLEDTVINTLTDGTLEPKMFTRVGSYIVASVPVSTPDTTACTVIMSASQARIFNIDKSSKRIVGTSDVVTAPLRKGLLTLLMRR